MSKQTFENFKQLWEGETDKIKNEAIDGDGVSLIRLHFELNRLHLEASMNEDDLTQGLNLELEMLEAKLETALQIAHSRFRLKNRGILASIFGGIVDKVTRRKTENL
jgi:hypothetical protein